MPRHATLLRLCGRAALPPSTPTPAPPHPSPHLLSRVVVDRAAHHAVAALADDLLDRVARRLPVIGEELFGVHGARRRRRGLLLLLVGLRLRLLLLLVVVVVRLLLQRRGRVVGLRLWLLLLVVRVLLLRLLLMVVVLRGKHGSDRGIGWERRSARKRI